MCYKTGQFYLLLTQAGQERVRTVGPERFPRRSSGGERRRRPGLPPQLHPHLSGTRRIGAHRAAYSCRWPDGCNRGGFRFVVMPEHGERYLCLRHAGEVWNARKAANRAAGLCACGAVPTSGYRTCARRRERARADRLRARAFNARAAECDIRLPPAEGLREAPRQAGSDPRHALRTTFGGHSFRVRWKPAPIMRWCKPMPGTPAQPPPPSTTSDPNTPSAKPPASCRSLSSRAPRDPPVRRTRDHRPRRLPAMGSVRERNGVGGCRLAALSPLKTRQGESRRAKPKGRR